MAAPARAQAIPSATISSTVMGISFCRARDHGPFSAASIQTSTAMPTLRRPPQTVLLSAKLGNKDQLGSVFVHYALEASGAADILSPYASPRIRSLFRGNLRLCLHGEKALGVLRPERNCVPVRR